MIQQKWNVVALVVLELKITAKIRIQWPNPTIYQVRNLQERIVMELLIRASLNGMRFLEYDLKSN